MNRLLYVSFENSENRASGINKKINGQIDAFRTNGYDVDLAAVYGKGIACFSISSEPVVIRGKCIPRITLCSWVAKHALNYDVVYIRFQFFCPFVLNMLKKLHKNNVKVIMEIPTYPYASELKSQGMKGIPKRIIDSTFGSHCAKYIDAFASPLYGGEILGKKSIEIYNGIDIDKVNPRNPRMDNVIDLLAVAMMAPWHGYDRLIEGIHRYYENGGKRRIVLHLVGEGPATPEYKRLVEKYAIDKHVIFHGKKSGLDLDAMYDIADIGVGSLATVQKKIYKANALKVLEYMAKGLPVICEEVEVGIPKESAYRLTVISDQPSINIEEIIGFYDSIYTVNEPVDVIIEDLRRYCKDNCSVDVGLSGVFEFLNNTNK